MKTCKWCKQKFEPSRPSKICCSPDCEYDYGLKHAARAESIRALEDRKVIKMKLEEMKPLSYYADKAQKAVNQYRRELLSDEPCISCGRHHQGQYHAGHFVSRGASPALRYEHLNIWKQCKPCNVDKSGNLLEYRKALVARIGIEKVEWLEGPHELKRWRKDDYLRIEAEHKQLLKELQHG